MKAKRLFSLFLLMAMVMSLFSGAVYASGDDQAVEEIPEEVIEEVTEEVPVEDEGEEEVPVEAEVSDEEEAPVEEDAPVEEEASVEKEAPVEEEASEEPEEDAASEEPAEAAEASEEPAEDGATNTKVVSYVDQYGSEHTVTATVIDEAMMDDMEELFGIIKVIFMEPGWYVAEGTFLMDRAVYIRGDVKLILADGCDLTCEWGRVIKSASGISLEDGAKLTIYGQKQGTGTLRANGTSNGAGICCNSGTSLIINGGIVLAEAAEAGVSVDTLASNNGISVDGAAGFELNTDGAEGEDLYIPTGAGIGSVEDSSCGSITINGGTVIAAGARGSAGIGGGEYSSGRNITITGGIVVAAGGATGAGIGGGDEGDGRDIRITGGTVKAYGSNGSAGIGGGRYGDGKAITISGNAVVYAYGGSCDEFGGAGIGGGNYYSGQNITIGGSASVYAEGGSMAAGIGGGAGNSGSSITINSGNVTAKGGTYEDLGGAGIGGGASGSADSGSGTNITINGGVVNATGGFNGAGIGGGQNCDGRYITINGGDVSAFGGGGGVSAGIGGGREGVGSDITITGGTVYALGATNSDNIGGAGIGGGYKNNGGVILISGGDVTAIGGGTAAGIGGGDTYGGGPITITGGTVVASAKGTGAGIGGGGGSYFFSTITISGGDVTATSDHTAIGAYHLADTVSIPNERSYIALSEQREGQYPTYHSGADSNFNSTLQGKKYVHIIAPAEILRDTEYVCDGEVKSVRAAMLTNLDVALPDGWYFVDGTVDIPRSLTIKGDVKLILCDGCELTVEGEGDLAGICVTGDNRLAIYGQSGETGILTAKGGAFAAGIGGGNGQSGGNVTIYGGVVNAVGGNYAAGIGGGYERSGSSITIAGGSVTASGGICGAGIGGGDEGDGTGITILGGNVNACGGSMGAGIGGGANGNGENITISGGVVAASGKLSAAGIGGGARYGSSVGSRGEHILISGGIVTAAGENANAIGGPGGVTDIRVTNDLVVLTGDRASAVEVATERTMEDVTEDAGFMRSTLYIRPGYVVRNTDGDMVLGYYDSFSAAWAAAAGVGNVTMQLRDDVSADAARILPEGVSLTIDLYGKKLTVKDCIYAKKGSLTVADSVGGGAVSCAAVVQDGDRIVGFYANLGQALDYAFDLSAPLVRICGNCSLWERTVPEGCELTLDLCGKTIFLEEKLLAGKGSITLTDSVGSGSVSCAASLWDGDTLLGLYGDFAEAWAAAVGMEEPRICLCGKASAAGLSLPRGCAMTVDLCGNTLHVEDSLIVENRDFILTDSVGGGKVSCAAAVQDGDTVLGWYAGLAAAWEKAAELKTPVVRLCGNCFVDGLKVPAGKTFTLDLNGCTVYSSGDCFTSGGELILKDGVGGGQISCAAAVYDGDTALGWYSTFAGAWARAVRTEEPTVRLFRDCTGDSWTVPENCMLTLDLNGHTLTGGDGDVFTVDGVLILKDSIGGGSILGGRVENHNTYIAGDPNFTLPDNDEQVLPRAMTYMDGDTEKIQLRAQNIADAGNVLYGGWYYVSGELTIDNYILVYGDVRLILTDGCNLTVNAPENKAAFTVMGDDRLTVYGQSAGTGTLTANGGVNAAGIGGSFRRTGCNITICGGVVYANGGENGAGIGGGQMGKGTDITISGGTVYAQGGYGGAGIGGGREASAESITITDGSVTATGGYRGAGIGGGDYGSVEGIEISGGTVTANGGPYSAGIGGGRFGSGKNIEISGGEIIAAGGEYGAGIGGGTGGNAGYIRITGGRITALGGTDAMAVGAGDGGRAYDIYVAAGLPIVAGKTEVCSGHTSSADLSDNSEFRQNSLTVGIAAPAPTPTPTPVPNKFSSGIGGGTKAVTPSESPEPEETPVPTVTPVPAKEEPAGPEPVGEETTEEEEKNAAPALTDTPAEDTGDGDTGSVFGGSSIVLLVVGAVVILGGAAACVIAAKKKKTSV